MNKRFRNIGVIIVCLTVIIYWVYKGIYNDVENTNIDNNTKNTANIIFRILEKDIPIQDLNSMVGDSTIKYDDDSTSFINILRNQETIDDVSIDKIAPLSTSEFLSLLYKKTTFNNYKTYLKNNNNFNNWDSIYKDLNSDYNFNLSELANYIKEIGFFTTNNTTYYYLKTKEPHNVSSILNYINDSNETYISEKRRYYKIHLDNLFQLLADKLFTKNNNYYFSTSDYFIFASDTTQLYNLLYLSLDTGNFLENNPVYLDYKRHQSAKYGLHYYSDITKSEDSNNTIISYQLRDENTMVSTHLKIFKFEKKQDIPIDSLLTDTIRTDTPQNTLDDSLSSSTTITDSLKKEEDLGEIRYTLVAEETFRKATLKLKLLLEKNNYDYNKVKIDHVFFIVDNGTTKLNWNTAVKRYLDKKQPKEGDYFLMKKFFY
tara:strand:+ start:1697 stop:2986 length:1290 start_codon:yes stop_codon:yes gene_type:complete